MRIRSCQLVYLLLLLCSVQIVDARAVGLLAWDNGGRSVISTADTSAGEPHLTPRCLQARVAAHSAPAGPQAGTRPTIEWLQAADHAATVSVHTGFQRA